MNMNAFKARAADESQIHMLTVRKWTALINSQPLSADEGVAMRD